VNTDIRISVEFWDHPKTIKLERRGGLEAVRSLQILWAWAAQNKPCGNLEGLDEEDIEISGKWRGKAGVFCKALVDLRWLDSAENGFILHDWREHNPWAADATNRADKARLSRLAKINRPLYNELASSGTTALTRDEYERLTTVQRPLTNRISPAPSPSPAPKTHKEKPTSKEKQGKDSPSIGKDVDVVFSYWKEKLKHPQAQLGGKRKVIIAARIKEGYTIDALKEAIDGCSKSQYHQGKNDSNMVYDSIELICRDAEHVDRFRKIACMTENKQGGEWK